MADVCVCDAGVVRAESFTRLPPSLHTTSAGPRNPSGSSLGIECLPNSTSEEDLLGRFEGEDDDDEAGLLQRLATRHYYSYTAALGVTIGVGCLLLVLNMLIFAGIYYQRDRDRRRHSAPSGSSSSASSEGIPLSQRPQQTQATCRAPSPAPTAHVIKVHEPPPSYTTVAKSPSIPDPPPPPRQPARQGCGAPSSTPVPPVRSTSTSNGGTVKKRVQIQEISV